MHPKNASSRRTSPENALKSFRRKFDDIASCLPLPRHVVAPPPQPGTKKHGPLVAPPPPLFGSENHGPGQRHVVVVVRYSAPHPFLETHLAVHQQPRGRSEMALRVLAHSNQRKLEGGASRGRAMSTLAPSSPEDFKSPRLRARGR